MTTSTPPTELAELLQRGYRYAYSLTHEAAAAEDLLQDGWLSLLKAGGERSVAYLFRAVRSRFIDRCRRERLVVMTELQDDDAAAATSADNADAVITADLLDRALNTLRAEEREALYLSAVEGYTAQEIAEFTDRSPGAVRTLLHRVRGKVRQFVEHHDTREVIG